LTDVTRPKPKWRERFKFLTKWSSIKSIVKWLLIIVTNYTIIQLITPYFDSITLVYIVIVAILTFRKRHPAEVYSIWLVFFIFLLIGLYVAYYLEHNGYYTSAYDLMIFKRKDDPNYYNSDPGPLGPIETALSWYLSISRNVHDEIVFIVSVTLFISIPQILSYLVSGIFGCARPPALLSRVTDLAFVTLIKFFCVLSAFKFANLFYFIYRFPDMTWEQIYLHLTVGGPGHDAFSQLATTFFLAAVYSRFGWILDPYRLFNNKFMTPISRFMTRYSRADPERT
jgi:hypothetical protein